MYACEISCAARFSVLRRDSSPPALPPSSFSYPRSVPTLNRLSCVDPRGRILNAKVNKIEFNRRKLRRDILSFAKQNSSNYSRMYAQLNRFHLSFPFVL